MSDGSTSHDSGHGPGADGDTRPGGGEGRGRSRLLRRTLAWIGAAAAAVLVLYLAAAVALRTLVPPETLADWAEPRAEATLNRDVEIGGAELAIFPHLGLVLDDLRVGNLPDFEGPPLARVAEAELRVALWPLLRGNVVVDEAVAHGVDLRLQVDARGRSNFGDLVPASEEPEPGGGALPVSLAVRDVRALGSRVEYRDRTSGRLLVLDSLRADGSLQPADGSWRLDLDARAGELAAALPSLRAEPFRPGAAGARLRLRVGPGAAWLEVEEGTVRAAGVPLSLVGRVDSLRSPVRRLSLALEADSLALSSLARSVPAGTLPDGLESLRGTASVRVDVTGPAGEGRAPEVSGSLDLRGAGASLAGRGSVADGLSGTIRLRRDTLTVERLAGSVLGGPFRLTDAAFRLDSTRSFSGRLESTASLAALSPAAGPGGPSGTVQVSLEVAGTASRPEAATARGTVLLDAIALPADSPRAVVRIPRGTLRVDGRTASWTGVPVLVGDDSTAVRGSVEPWGALLSGGRAVPRISAGLEAPRLDLGQLLSATGDRPTWAQLVFARLGRDSISGRTPAEWAAGLGYERPDRLPAAGRLEIAVDTLIYRPYRFRPAAARIEFGPDLLRVTEAELGLFGGRLVQTTSLSLGEDGGRFAAEIDAGGVAAPDFLATSSPFGRLLTGSLDLELSATGRLDRRLLPVRDSLVGRGQLSVAGGGLAPNPVTGAVADLLDYPALRSPTVERLTVPFRVRGGTVRFDTALLATPAGGVEWAGAAGLDGALDLGARLRVPRARLPELDLEGAGLAGDVLSRLRGGSGPLELGLGVAGDASSPRVTVDVDALGAAAADAARDAAGAAIRQRLERNRGVLEERARGLLRRLSGERDTASADTTGPGRPEDAAGDTAGEPRGEGAADSTDAAASGPRSPPAYGPGRGLAPAPGRPAPDPHHRSPTQSASVQSSPGRPTAPFPHVAPSDRQPPSGHDRQASEPGRSGTPATASTLRSSASTVTTWPRPGTVTRIRPPSSEKRMARGRPGISTAAVRVRR